jgi:hypothetical protein
MPEKIISLSHFGKFGINEKKLKINNPGERPSARSPQTSKAELGADP